MISVAAQFNDELAMNVLAWAQRINSTGGPWVNAVDKQSLITKIKDQKSRQSILELLNAADLGIQDIIYQKHGLNSNSTVKKAMFSVNRNLDFIGVDFLSDIKTIHDVFDTNGNITGHEAFSVYADESTGTLRFLLLSGVILDVLESGGILLADELDASLHPALVKKIAELFNSEDVNKANAQLIFNTHDTNLLNENLFRRDQIWFTEKGRLGDSKLFSLSDFKSGGTVRKDTTYGLKYIDGRYGAVPYLGYFDDFRASFVNEAQAKYIQTKNEKE
jgi:AAA15 family ATPase/GTPase